MEFLVTGGHDLHPSCVEVLSASFVDSVSTPTFTRFGPISMVATGAPVGDRTAYLFDGELAADGRFFHPLVEGSGDHLRQVAEKALDSGTSAIDGGVFCLGRVSAAGLEMIVDPLNQYPLYWTRGGAGWAVSNNVLLLARALEYLGLPCDRSLEPCVEYMLLGGFTGTKTHVRQINTLPAGTRISAGHVLRLPEERDESLDVRDYETALEQARTSIFRHLEAAATTIDRPRTVVADVTGGIDSRCVLSFARRSSLAGELTGRCITRVPNPDARVAGHLMTRFGIPVARFPMVDTVPAGFVDELAVRHNAALWGGGRDVAAPVAPVAFADVMHLKGSYGELGGGTRGLDYVVEATRLGGYTHRRAVGILAERRRRARALDLLTPAALDHAEKLAAHALGELEAAGYPREDLKAEMYLRSRSRAHFGLYSTIENKNRLLPDLFANRWMVAARRSLDRRLYSQDQVVFDLIVQNDPELAFAPMADKVWSEDVVPADMIPRLRDMQAVTRESTDFAAIEGPLFTSVRVGGHGVQNFAPLTRGAPQVESTLTPLHRSISSYQEVLRYLLDAVPTQHAVWDWFDRAMVGQYVGQEVSDFASHGVDVQSMGRAAAGIIWQLREEVAPHVTSVQRFAAVDA